MISEQSINSTRGVIRPGTDRWPLPEIRQRIPGGHLIAVDVQIGDELTITDLEGGQPALIGFFGPSGQVDPELAILDGPASRTVCDAGLHCLNPAILKSLKKSGIILSGATGLELFSRTGTEGATRHMQALKAGIIVIGAPAVSDDVNDTGHGTELRVAIRRVKQAHVLTRPLPEPLFDPRLDLFLERRKGFAYEVKAGEYIQVLDIDGKQCSDFMAFPRRALDKQLERFIDSTVTRTMVRAAYPGPGLADKFFDQDMQPLLSVVQDTCGRHDTFGLACAERIYDANGFFGHDNCSDNISDAMKPYGITRRAAWPAINFFFNTHVAQGNAILSDEGWSRPGDYVLMRALTDLVCVSTACPDDTSPINGWDPTDIQVRVYPSEAPMRKSFGFRAGPTSEVIMTRETGFHPRTSALTRHYAAAKDCWIPQSFTESGVVAEYWATRNAATIQDLSQLRKFDITGPDAENLMDYALARDIRKIAIGQVSYSPMCRPTGAMFDDGTLFRLSPRSFRWMAGNNRAGDWLKELARERRFDVQIRDVSESICNVAVQGPRSREILASIIWSADTQPKLVELKWFRFMVGRLIDYNGPALMVSRTGYTGELGFEIFCHPKDAIAVWDAVMHAGEPFGLIPMGLEALDIIRIEAALPVAGHEFGENIDPFEAGCGFAVPLSGKPADFVGKAALQRIADASRAKLVGLKLDTLEPVHHGDPVFEGQTQVGMVTSAAISPGLGSTIAMARLAIDYCSPGRTLEIGRLDHVQKRLIASVTSLPFHDPEKIRIRS